MFDPNAYNSPGRRLFDEVLVPAVTAGAYSANDIMGGFMEFPCAGEVDRPFMLHELQFTFKSAVVPSLLAVVCNGTPGSTTLTDNAAYSLNVADAFKVRRSIPVNALGGYLTDHGTPNTIVISGLTLVMKPIPGTVNMGLILVDLTGVTLASVADLQVRAAGFG